MANTFDGPTKLITLDHTGPVTTISAGALYGDWKEWVRVSDNAKYLRAFDLSVGGNPAGDSFIDGYYFLNNVDGWRIKPFEADHEVIVQGNLYGLDPNTTIWTPTTGAYNVQTRIELSSRSLSSFTATDRGDLLLARRILDNKIATDPATGKQILYDDDGTLSIREWELWEDIAETQGYQGNGADVRDTPTDLT